jgi:hypothetical protein
VRELRFAIASLNLSQTRVSAKSREHRTAKVRSTLTLCDLLRLSAARLLQCTAAGIRRDAEQLLAAAGDTRNLGICCINLDFSAPDENVRAMLEVAASAG